MGQRKGASVKAGGSLLVKVDRLKRFPFWVFTIYLMICSQPSGGLQWGAWSSFLESEPLGALNVAAHETLDAVIKRQDRRVTAEIQRRKHERHLEEVLKREKQRR